MNEEQELTQRAIKAIEAGESVDIRTIQTAIRHDGDQVILGFSGTMDQMTDFVRFRLAENCDCEVCEMLLSHFKP